MLKKSNGFTIVEMVLILVVVGVLAAITVPIYRTSLRRARGKEAIAVMGVLRTHMRSIRNRTGAYNVRYEEGALPPIPKLFTVAPGIYPILGEVDSVDHPKVIAVPGFTGEDLNGDFFLQDSYFIEIFRDDPGTTTIDEGASTYQLRTIGIRPGVRDVLIIMDQDGKIINKRY